MQNSSHKPGTLIERFTRWVGSTSSVIVHTVVFIAAFLVGLLHILAWELVLLILTTAVSLEAIYLAIFIQMTVNRNTESLISVEADIDEIQEDIDEVQADVAEISEDMEEVQEDVAEISEDIDAVQEDLEEDDAAGKKRGEAIAHISETLQKLIAEVENLKK